MSIKKPFTDLEIVKAESGFYENNSVPIALISKSIMVALVLWALVFPANANSTLGSWNFRLLEVSTAFTSSLSACFFTFWPLLPLSRPPANV